MKVSGLLYMALPGPDLWTSGRVGIVSETRRDPARYILFPAAVIKIGAILSLEYSDRPRLFQNRLKASPLKMRRAKVERERERERERDQRAEREREREIMSASPSSLCYYYRWKSFSEDEDRPEKPRRFGFTEVRSPSYSLFSQNALQDIFESMGQFVDGLKFSGGSHSLMPKASIKEIIDLAHRHDVYVSTGDWAEHMLRKGPSSFKQYVEDCKQLGFDTIELNAGTLKVPEETLLRFIRLIKTGGLKVRPQFAVKFDTADMPIAGDRAFGAYVAPVSKNSEIVEDVNLLIRRAERCLESGADMIMIDADDVCKFADSMREDIIAKIIGRLGLEKTMFEASDSKTSEWFVKQYGPKVNLFIDPSDVMNLECLRGRSLGDNHASLLNTSCYLI